MGPHQPPQRAPMALAAVATALIAYAPSSCPTVSTVGSTNFNLTEWVRASWFPQQQQVTGYQPETSLFCVSATYNLEGAKVPFFSGTVVTVYNYANKDNVNGEN